MANTPHSMVDWIGYITHGEVDFLAKLADIAAEAGIGPGHYVNIGAGAGISGMTIRSTRPFDHMTTVDIRYKSSPFGCIEGEKKELEAAGFADQKYYHWIVGDSKEVGKSWSGGKVNMVFIDGDHSYDGCSGDIIAWMENLCDDGIMAIHDYKKDADNKPWPDVDKSVDDLLLGKYEHVGTVDSLIAFRKRMV